MKKLPQIRIQVLGDLQRPITLADDATFIEISAAMELSPRLSRMLSIRSRSSSSTNSKMFWEIAGGHDLSSSIFTSMLLGIIQCRTFELEFNFKFLTSREATELSTTSPEHPISCYLICVDNQRDVDNLTNIVNKVEHDSSKIFLLKLPETIIASEYLTIEIDLPFDNNALTSKQITHEFFISLQNRLKGFPGLTRQSQHDHIQGIAPFSVFPPGLTSVISSYLPVTSEVELENEIQLESKSLS